MRSNPDAVLEPPKSPSQPTPPSVRLSLEGQASYGFTTTGILFAVFDADRRPWKYLAISAAAWEFRTSDRTGHMRRASPDDGRSLTLLLPFRNT